MVELGLKILQSRLTSHSPPLAWPLLLLKCLWNPPLCCLTLSALSLSLCLPGLSLSWDLPVLPLEVGGLFILTYLSHICLFLLTLQIGSIQKATSLHLSLGFSVSHPRSALHSLS